MISCEGTLLDHVNLGNDFTNSATLTSTRIQLMSDHNFTITMIQMNSVSPENKRKEKKLIDLHSAVSEIKMNLSNFEYAPLHFDINIAFENFHDILISAVENNTKKRLIKMPSHLSTLPAWSDERYMQMLHTLYNLEEKIEKRRMLNLQIDELKIKYLELNMISERYASVKSKIYYRNCAIDNLSSAWNVINDLTGRKKNNNNGLLIRDTNGTIIHDSKVIADIFQERFLEIVNLPTLQTQDHKYLGKLIGNTFVFDEIRPFTVFAIIGSFKVNKSPGFDNLSPKLLKECNEQLCTYMANYFNQMIRSCIFPNRLKLSTVTPIFKNGDKTCMENYRPISILSQIDKVFETIIYDQINSFLEEHNIMDNLQYGFRAGRGCQDAVCKILNHISKLNDTGMSVIVISLDISKAFDSVSHQILLRKMHFLGFRGPSFELMESFLKDRRQIVKVNNVTSEEGNVLNGVPQGSNLGPLLFNLMICDISELKTNATLYKYADDLIMILPLSHNPSENTIKLEHDLSIIGEYYEMNQLKINLTKSKCMIVGKCDEVIEKSLQKHCIEKCTDLKYLGVIFDSEMKLIKHVDEIAKSVTAGINALRFLKTHLSLDSLLKFFYAHIQSHISYCSFILLRCRASDIERLQRLQNKCLKIIHGLPELYSTNELFNKEAKQILPVCGLIYYSALIMIKKSILTDDGSLPLIKRLGSTRKYNLILEKAKKKIMIKDITHTGIKLFNQLPEDIKRENNLNVFKRKAKDLLLSRNASLIKDTQFMAHNLFL